MYANHYSPDGKVRLYQVYFPYICPHCGHEGLCSDVPKYARCQKPDCRKPVELIGYTTVEEQEAEWAKEDKGIAGEYV